jgi:hypothetical protein
MLHLSAYLFTLLRQPASRHRARHHPTVPSPFPRNPHPLRTILLRAGAGTIFLALVTAIGLDSAPPARCPCPCPATGGGLSRPASPEPAGPHQTPATPPACDVEN